MSGNDHEHLSYRALGERLSISPDAARMKAKRKAWRIIPGNRPNAPVWVEVPLTEVAERGPREQAQLYRPRTIAPEQPDIIIERLMNELAAARARNDYLTDKLIEANDVLSVAYDKLIELNQHVVSARMELIAAKDEVIAVKAIHQRDERELAAAEMREMGTKSELERALGHLAVQELRGRQDTHRQRPWWRRR